MYESNVWVWVSVGVGEDGWLGRWLSRWAGGCSGSQLGAGQLRGWMVQ